MRNPSSFAQVFFPKCSGAEGAFCFASASILKPVPAFETLAVCCTYAKSMAQGLLIVIEGKITDGAGETLATATAEMVDLSKM